MDVYVYNCHDLTDEWLQLEADEHDTILICTWDEGADESVDVGEIHTDFPGWQDAVRAIVKALKDLPPTVSTGRG